MNTAFLLMARHHATPILPLDVVARDYFSTTEKTLVRKIDIGEIDLPVVRLERRSQKCAKGISLAALATYLDARMVEAKKEHAAMMRARR